MNAVFLDDWSGDQAGYFNPNEIQFIRLVTRADGSCYLQVRVRAETLEFAQESEHAARAKMNKFVQQWGMRAK